MNRQIYNTHMYLFNNCGCEQKKCSKLPLSFLLLYYYLYSCFILIQQKKVAHVMPRLVCYMHACVHVGLIILI